MAVIDITPLIAAAKDRDELSFWLSMRMADLVGELEEEGLKLEDIPEALTDYAAWMRANLGLFQMK